MNSSILEVKNISISFDNKKTYILKDISFSVEKWQTISIIGMNGSGKSTLLKSIAGIQKLSSWEIEKGDISMSYVPQKINIDSSFPISVIEFIKIYNKWKNKKDILKYLKKFKSSSLLEKNVGDLSGWELQKVLIISSILSKPDLILLDEPTSGIDIMWEEIFYNNISELKNLFPDISIIIVSHNIHLVYKNSDKVVCLHKNNFCCHGTPEQLKENQSVQDIFWDSVALYEHNPHNKHNH
jgi:zinc transport system ATP-binding protein